MSNSTFSFQKVEARQMMNRQMDSPVHKWRERWSLISGENEFIRCRTPKWRIVYSQCSISSCPPLRLAHTEGTGVFYCPEFCSNHDLCGKPSNGIKTNAYSKHTGYFLLRTPADTEASISTRPGQLTLVNTLHPHPTHRGSPELQGSREKSTRDCGDGTSQSWNLIVPVPEGVLWGPLSIVLWPDIHFCCLFLLSPHLSLWIWVLLWVGFVTNSFYFPQSMCSLLWWQSLEMWM